MRDVVTFLQVSDIHLFADCEASLLGVKTDESFRAVLDLLQTDTTSQCLVLTGDLSQDESEASYARILAYLKFFDRPIYCFPGNHDDVPLMQRVYRDSPIHCVTHVLFEHWILIFLNSQQLGTPAGHLSDAELSRMDQLLQVYPTHHALIMLHHPPLCLESTWLDSSTLQNSDVFWAHVRQYQHVRGVVAGHVHQAFQGVLHGVSVYTAPSTCIQFKPKQNQFKLDFLPPGYRSFHLLKDGGIQSEVHRALRYVGVFDEHAAGY